jgi:hypothetical protein
MEVYLELIRVNIYEKFENPVMKKAGMLAEGKVGIERVVEALQCNMWSTMVRKPMPNFRQRVAENLQKDDEQTAQTQSSNNKEEKVIEKTETKSENDQEEKKEAKHSENSKPTPVYLDPLNPLLPIPDYSQTFQEAPPNDFEKDERDLEELGSLMVEIRNLKDKLKGMTMDERRSNAEDMIRKIAGFMDLEDEEDLFDSDEDVDYDKIMPDQIEMHDLKAGKGAPQPKE